VTKYLFIVRFIMRFFQGSVLGPLLFILYTTLLVLSFRLSELCIHQIRMLMTSLIFLDYECLKLISITYLVLL